MRTSCMRSIGSSQAESQSPDSDAARRERRDQEQALKRQIDEESRQREGRRTASAGATADGSKYHEP